MPTPIEVMSRAIELARRGAGAVEPNPMVGAVVVSADGEVISEGWHQRYGGPHAEIFALQSAGERARGGTLYVTLEPCSHHGKTPPCADAVIAAGIMRVVIATSDPFPEVNGKGIAKLQAAGVQVDCGLLEHEANQLLAPFRKRVLTGLPWVIAKWAMTLDGRIACRTGASQWISNVESRKVVHELRGRVDAVMVGIETAIADDPLLTARPAGVRIAKRIVVDSHARLPLDSKLVKSARETPTWVAVTPNAPQARIDALTNVGVEVLPIASDREHASDSADFESQAPRVDLRRLLARLAERGLTNVLVEGGGGVLGALFDQQLVDEVHVFVAPIIVGGAEALSPLAGLGCPDLASAHRLEQLRICELDGDVYISGRMTRPGQ